jgi:nicotinamide-nucleotide amidase
VRVAEDEVIDEIARLLDGEGASIGVAESLTGGLLVQALARTAGSGGWLAGGVVAYATAVKRTLLGVTAPRVISGDCAEQMAAGARRVLGADIVVAVTGVGGPDPQDGEPAGTVWIAVDDGTPRPPVLFHADGDPAEICRATVDEALRRVLEALRGACR